MKASFALTALLCLALTCHARAGSIDAPSLSVGVVAEIFFLLDSDFKSMLRDADTGFHGLTVNKPCDDATAICILFVDASKALVEPALRRFRRTFELTRNNMLALAPNVILIDEAFADLLLFSCDVDGKSYFEWLDFISMVTERSNVHDFRKKRKQPPSFTPEDKESIRRSFQTS